MLYFSHMNRLRSAFTESTHTISALIKNWNTSFFLDELSPFSLFLSQFLYMAAWIFPEGRLPDELRSAAGLWEGESRTSLDQINGGDDDLV